MTDADGLVEGLRAHHATGATMSAWWRREQLDGLRRMLAENESHIVDAGRADMARPPFETVMSEVITPIRELVHLRRHVGRWARPERVAPGLRLAGIDARIVRQPLGVVLVLSPWNYPVQLSVLPVAAAIAAGNAVVLKPSELAPATSRLLADLVPRYVDDRAIAVVEGGADVAAELLRPRWDHIFFTGGGRVGRIVAEAAARHLTPTTLELGGANPVLVDRSADVRVAARRIAWGRFFNAGQTCVAPNHVLVDRSIEHRLIDELVGATRAMFGPDPRTSPHYGRLVSEAHHDRVTGLLPPTNAGRVALGGDGDRRSRYLAPTVLVDVDEHHPAAAEEVFGPVLAVAPVPSLAAAIEVVNAGDRPLAVYPFGDRAAVAAVVDGTVSGGVCANDVVLQLSLPQLPLGGVGGSGLGAYHGRWGFEQLSHRKSVFARSTRFDPAAYRAPYRRWKLELLRRAL